MSGLDFPDQIHIDKIRSDLWCGREYGRASIMVGAGFSRNAERLSQSIPPFPLLQGLASTMYQVLYPSRDPLAGEEQSRKARATSGSGILRLAREYEAEFGRPALDELIIKALPDENYLPGRLHRLLLTLPWSDVFTTNYDTLLERARAQVHERKFDLIQTVHDIPGRMKPRIVKLHGSFPSHRPFIVTEDDYRTYPAQFAPFVNMVQQSIMENSLLLIGFSGDDPNFLYWSGWVRDNLKEATPTIYLCGLLNLSPAARKVLQTRRVIPIDLSPLFPASVWPDSDVRHSKALEWLLLNLMHGAISESTNWPEPSRTVFEEPSQGLPEIPAGPKPLSGNGPHFSDPQSLKLGDFETVRGAWSLNRMEYPGWVVAPKENRDNIWNYTEHWIDTVFAKVESISFPENLLLLYELNWRLELTLTPLFVNQVEKIAAILNEINPFPHLIEIENAKFRPDVKETPAVNWAAISKCWVELTFALAREAREDLDEQRFRLWMDRLKPVIPQGSDLQARWFYEEAMFCLFRLNQNGLLQVLRSWPRMPDLPFWESKRASLLAELGNLDEAERVAEDALSRVRARVQPYRTDHALLSQEGFIMLLLKAITSMRLSHETTEKFRARWDKLGSFGCNPWEEVERFRLALGSPQPKATPPTETKMAFDPGQATTTYHGSPGIRIHDFKPAFGLLRFYEDGGIPLRCGMVNLFTDEGATAAKWVSPFAPLWSLSVLLRTGQDRWIQEIYDRVRLAAIAQNAANAVYRLCSEGLRQSLEWFSTNAGASEGHLANRLVPTLAELLSRLAFRLDDDEKAVIFDHGVQLYNLGASRGDFTALRHSPALLQRSVFCMTKDEAIKRVPILLSLPIPGEPGYETAKAPEIWTEPFDYFELSSRITREIPLGVDWSTPISRLIRLTATKNRPLVRKRAAARLAGLHRLGLLNQTQCNDFANALWSETDPKTKLPTNTDFYFFAFLGLPEINPGDAVRLIRAYLLETEIPRMFSRTRLPDGKEQKTFTPGARENRYIREVLGATKPLFPADHEGSLLIDWSREEAMIVLKKMASWWNDEKSELHTIKGDQWFNAPDQLRNQFEAVVDVMAKVVLPRLNQADAAVAAQASELLSEMEQCGFCILAAVPMQLFIKPEFCSEAASQIRGGLISNNQSSAQEAMAGLFLWLAHSQMGHISAPPDDLIATLINKVKTRSQPALVNAIGQVKVIVEKMPSVLNSSQIEDLSIGLDYLLTETKFQETLDSAEQDAQRLIPIAKIPLYRRYACGLAASIYSWCLAAKDTIPGPILKWKETAETDVLPEVRLEWQSSAKPEK